MGLARQIVAGTITSRKDGVEYLHWTYYYRRVLMNPSYYNLAIATAEGLTAHLTAMIENAMIDLEGDGCISAWEAQRVCAGGV